MDTAQAEVFPVGEFLADELDARDWTQAEFAEIIDRPAQFVSEIVSGKKEITRESAAQIGAALGTSPQIWLNLQDDYLLWKQEQNENTRSELSDVARRAKLNEKGPISLLKRRGILQGANLDELEKETLKFFELRSLDEEPQLRLAAKKANHDEPLSALQTAWAYCVKHKAREALPPANYSADALAAIGADLPRKLTTPEAFANLPDRLAGAGVRLVYVPALPGAKIDGCAMYVDGVPVIGLSGRGKRLDKILFALLHEISHIAHGHVDAESDGAIVEEVEEDLDESGAGRTIEAEANKQAGTWILPTGFGSIPARVTGPWLSSTASRTGLAQIVVVGRLQHMRRLDWRTTHAKDAPTVGHVLESW